ncbi:MAG: hypothetical protein CMP22_03350 [Rickettsiales bacterium]|nr:hypothetical protein [Rickettsiales bacterium]
MCDFKRRLVIEELESRNLLSTITSNSLLRPDVDTPDCTVFRIIDGTGHNDHISITSSMVPNKYNVLIDSYKRPDRDPSSLISSISYTVKKGIDFNDVILVTSGPGNDKIQVSESITTNFRINAGSGRNLIYSGSGDDILYAKDSHNELFGGNGDDLLFGGTGSNILGGGEGNDVLVGSHSIDTLYGGPGRDLLVGFEGNDRLDGQSGDDWLFAGDGADHLYGGEGNDALFGGKGDDSLYGQKHDDTIYADGGIKTISVTVPGPLPRITHQRYAFEVIADRWRQTNHQTISDFNDKFAIHENAFFGRDTVRGGQGDDYIDGGPGRDSLYGEGGNDEIHAGRITSGHDIPHFQYQQISTRGDYLDGGSGADLLLGSMLQDEIHGGGNSDIIVGDGYAVTAGVHGGRTSSGTLYFPDPWQSTTNNFGLIHYQPLFKDSVVDDIIYGDSGADKIYGGYGNDVLIGGEGNDVILGDSGYQESYWKYGQITQPGLDLHFQIFGAPSSYINNSPFVNPLKRLDYLTGHPDLIFGGKGDDLVHGGPGADYILGNEGNDILHGNQGDDVIHGDFNCYSTPGILHNYLQETPWQNGNITSWAPLPQIAPGPLDDHTYHDHIFGSEGNDLLFGNIGDDMMDGGHGKDRLYGDAGNDGLNGGSHRDTLFGGTGEDMLFGGQDYVKDAIFGETDQDTFYHWKFHFLNKDYIADKDSDETLRRWWSIAPPFMPDFD